MIFASQAGIIPSFIENCAEEHLLMLKDIILDVKRSDEFKRKWIDEFYSELEKWNPDGVQKFRGLKGILSNIFGELFGKLHIQEYPIMNSCSRRFLEKLFEFDKYDYNGFYQAFEKLKEIYLKEVGRLNEYIPTNIEIDMMFNYFDKDEEGKRVFNEILKGALKMSKYEQKSKTEPSQNYWIEIGGPPSKDFIGKFLWAPKAPQWKLFEEIQKDDVVYHYVTLKGPKEYREKFVGKSKVKERAREIGKDELVRIMRNIDESWEEFFEGWGNYETFYLVELYDYREFKKPVSKDEVRFSPPQKYFIRAQPEIVEKIERLTSTQGNADITLNDFFRSKGYLFPSEVVSQFYTALKTKGFVILSGLTGSGKTKMALEFADLFEPCPFLDDRPQLLTAWGSEESEDSLRKALDEIQKQIRTERYATLLWGPAGIAVQVPLPFVLWVTYKNQVRAGFMVKNVYKKDEIEADEVLRKRLQKEYEWAKIVYGGNENSFLEDIKYLENKHGTVVAFEVCNVFIDQIDLTKFERINENKPVTIPKSGYMEVKLTGESVNKIAKVNSKKLFLSVRPDWRDSKPLIGWYNPLTEKYEKTELLDLILKAINDKENPYFIILDEMNLAHVEYYFSDFLSVLESGRDENGFTRESIKLHSIDGLDDPPKEVKLPPNLYIIGTVNVDETTYAFSPKVLDRAFTIEFHDVLLEEYPPEAISNLPDPGTVTKIKEDFTRHGKFLGYSKDELNEAVKSFKEKEYWEELKKMNKALEPYDMHFGYRVIDEIAMFLSKAEESWKKGLIEFESEDEIFDLAILMKILPKFHGNRKKLEKPLKEVLKTCLADGIINVDGLDDRKVIELLENWDSMKEEFRFKHTAKKLLRMLRQLYEIGFASFS